MANERWEADIPARAGLMAHGRMQEVQEVQEVQERTCRMVSSRAVGVHSASVDTGNGAKKRVRVEGNKAASVRCTKV